MLPNSEKYPKAVLERMKNNVILKTVVPSITVEPDILICHQALKHLIAYIYLCPLLLKKNKNNNPKTN